KTLQNLAEQNLITVKAKQGGGREVTVSKWLEGRNCRMVEFDLKLYSQGIDQAGENLTVPGIQGEWTHTDQASVPFDD
ncbi:MAG: hypothetical protein LUE87_09105, partial [Lachnospiraceae bacterium]|nr:hypothetical protein [Lachnospiraceae bacterium]